MDWLRQIPIGQYVDSRSGWLRLIDPRLKLAWVLMFLITPILAGSFWRLSLVVVLFVITFISFLPIRIWLRSFIWLMILSLAIGLLAFLLPTGEPSATLPLRSPQELPGIVLESSSWEIFRLGPISFGPFSLGPFVFNKYSAELAVKSSSLIFTLVHSVNLMLITTKPEDLMWALNWFLHPLVWLGLPVDRLSFQLLLALRFLPLVQEEFQNLLRALAGRAISLKKLGLKASIGLLLALGERLLTNIILRAEQGAEALMVRGGSWLPPNNFRPKQSVGRATIFLNTCSGIVLVFVLSLRGKYGAL